MKTWLINWWDSYRTSFWFIPTLLAVVAIALAAWMPELDRWVASNLDRSFGWIVTTAAAARLSLSSIAGATITVTGVVFSITIVALANTASQFGSRLLRKTMDDIVTHVALGSLVATSLYCLLVLRVVHNSENSVLVPHLSVALGIVFAVASMGIFIFFLHNTALRLQAPNLIHTVATELHDAIDRLFPEQIGKEPDEDQSERVKARLDELGDDFATVAAHQHGYLQAIDASGLFDLAVARDLTIFIPNRPGSFLSRETTMVQIWPKEKVDKSLAHTVRMYFIVGHTRTPRQDVECAINELVEIAVRALSPGINDPFSAMSCLDYLGAALVQLAEREIPSPIRQDENGTARLLSKPVTFGEALQSAFRLILHFGCSNPAIVNRLLDSIANLVPHLHREDDKIAVQDEMAHIQRMIDEHLTADDSQSELLDRCDGIREQIAAGLKVELSSTAG